MAKQRGNLDLIEQRPRREGHALSLLRLSPMTNSAGKNFVSFGLDISSAPVPQRRYTAEICEVKIVRGDLRLVFAQEKLDGSGLESALIVRFNAHAAIQLLASIEDMKSPGVEAIASSLGIEAAPLTEINKQPAQMANVVANFAAVAISGYETCIDFYHASAFAMRQAEKSTNLEVEPIVRVDLQTSVFVSIFRTLKQLSSSLPNFPGETDHG